jgi:DNA topoisomerase IA
LLLPQQALGILDPSNSMNNGNRMDGHAAVLCEKPSQGKDIGRILGATQRGEGCLNGSGVTVTWCIGHLVEAAAPEVYDAALKRWSLEQLPIIPQQWRVEVKPKTATQFKVVKRFWRRRPSWSSPPTPTARAN